MEPLSTIAAIAASIEPADAGAAAVARARFADDHALAAVAGALAAAHHGPPRIAHRTLVVVASEAPPPLPTLPARAQQLLICACCDGPADAIRLDHPDPVTAGAALIIGLAEIGLDVLLLGAFAPTAYAIDVLAGAILAAASLRTAIILDGDATGAAAVAAVARQPLVRGYLLAAHRDNCHLAALGLAPVFPIGLGRGDGFGAALLLPLLDRVG